MPKSENSNQGLYGITVQTWGTKDKQSNGMLNFADQQLFGGDVGHASINMKLPIDDETKGWVEKYCCKQTYEQFKQQKGGEVSFDSYLTEVDKIIPFSQKKQEVRKAQFNESGVLQPSQERAYEQEYFDIDFSWWPSRVSTTTMDMIKEREGKHVNYAPEWRDYLQPVQRLHRGKLGQRLMDYDSLTVTHQRDLPDFVLERMKKMNQSEKNDEQLNAIGLLEKKIEALTNSSLSPTMHLMFKNIGIDIESLAKTFYAENKNTDLETFKNFLSDTISSTKRNLMEQNEEISTQLGDSSDVDALKQELSTLSTNLQESIENLTHIKQDDRLNELDALFNEVNAPIPLTLKVDSLVTTTSTLSELVKLEYSTLSAGSVNKLIAHIDDLILKQSGQEQTKQAQLLTDIAKYEEICEQYKNDDNAKEDALVDYFSDFDFDIESLRKQVKASSTSIEPLEQLKSELIVYQNKELPFSAELETKLNKVAANWERSIDEPCQFITLESCKQIAATVHQLKSAQDKEIAQLQQEQEVLTTQIKKAEGDLSYFEEFETFFEENSSAYSTLGRAPHHSVSLPLETPTSRGLSAPEMLKKMHELIEDPEKFNLYRKNCSLTSMEVLKAGAKHDSYLLQVMDTPALGFFGTPQQVLTNAQNARAGIDQQKTNTLLTTLSPDHYFDKVLGYGISLYMEKDSSKLQQAAGITIGTIASVAKVPGIMIDAVLDPKAALDDLVSTLDLIYERDSTKLKVGMTLLSLPALITLGTMAGVQKTLELTAAPFQFVYHKLSHQTVESMDLITVPVGGYQPEASISSSYNTSLAGLVNQGIKKQLDDQTISIAKQKNAKDTLDAFATALNDNPQKVVVLDPKAHDQLLSYVLKSEDADIKQRFYQCCNQSIARAAALQPKTKEAIRQFIPETMKAQPTEINQVIVEEHNEEENSLEENDQDESVVCSM